MTSIYLIRHGQASFGKDDYDKLSDLGEQQARRLGYVMSRRLPKFDVVCLGRMFRHRQTAQHCLAEFGVDLAAQAPTYDAGWNEYDHQNILAQFRPEFATPKSMMAFLRTLEQPKETFERDFNAAINRWISGEHDNDYAEPWSVFTSRVHSAFERTLEQNGKAKNIAVFTSGGPISLIGQHFLGVEEHKIMQMNWTLMNCGVTKIVATGPRPAGARLFLSALNEHTHFEGPDNKHFITYT